MRGNGKKCEDGCQCGKHSRSGNHGHGSQKITLVDWSDPEARKAYNRAKAREAYAADPAKFKGRTYRNHLRVTYGLTPEKFQDLLTEQGGNCYLCEEPLDTTPQNRGVYVDHDHTCCPGKKSCGKCVRGLACHQCNTGIGMFGDDPELIRTVAQNLREANNRLRG